MTIAHANRRYARYVGTRAGCVRKAAVSEVPRVVDASAAHPRVHAAGRVADLGRLEDAREVVLVAEEVELADGDHVGEQRAPLREG